MRRNWIVAVSLLLASCGQPLQINQPTNTLPTRVSQPQPTQNATSALIAEPTFPTTPEPTTRLEQTSTPESVGTRIASETPVVIISRTPSAQDLLDKWREQQIDRQVFENAQTFVAQKPASLLWYDPLTGQVLPIGTLIGAFTAQARFTTKSTNESALEVPYFINRDYGLTSISDAVRERMRAAGHTESVEAYVIENEGIVPK